MAIIPTVRCASMRTSLAFYTRVLDFAHVDSDDNLEDPSFSVLSLEGDKLILSSHRGDGEFGQQLLRPTTLTRSFESCVSGPLHVGES